MLKRITIAIGLLLAPSAALAQSSVLPYFYNSGGTKVPVGSSNPLPVTGSISASLSPFTPGLAGARGTPLTVTVADSSGNLPTNTGSVIVYNVGSNPMYCNVNGIAATTSDQYISSSGGWFNFGIPVGTTTLRCIATGGSTTANSAGGAGLGAGTGGGSGGSGGGGAITAASGAYASGSIASGAMVDLGSQADAVCSTDTGTCTAISLIKRGNQNTASAIPTQVSTVSIGGVGLFSGGTIMSATNGLYTNLLQGNAVISATNGTFANMLVGNAAVATGTGAVGVTTPRFAVGTDTATIAGSAPGTQTAPSSNYVAVNSGDPCFGAAKTTAPFSTSSGGPVSIVALSGSTKVYVCSITAVTDTAIKLSFIDGTGGSCASAQHAIWGSTTAASGMSLGATGGFASGNGGGTVGVTAAASAFCLLQSGTSLVAGSITYVQQ